MTATKALKKNTETSSQEPSDIDLIIQKIIPILLILLGLNLFITFLKIFTSDLSIYDDIEHLRAAYFISLGDVPYRDFFEHHHPILWYILAPLIPLFPTNTIISVYIARILSFIISLITGYYIYKTVKKFIGGKICALMCLNMYFWVFNDTSVIGIFQVKPDIYQRCCFFIGLYYLLNYFHYKKFKYLQISTLSLTVAFLFLQTTIFQGFLLALAVAYFLYHHPQKWPDIIKASILPLIILGICAGILWHHNLFKTYYELNWQLNAILAEMWSNIPTFLIFTYFILLPFAFASVYWHLKHKKRNFYWFLLAFLFIGEFIRCLYIARYTQHYLLLAIYAAIITAPYIYKNKKRIIAFLYVTIIYIILRLCSLSTPLLQRVEYQLPDKEEYGTTITSGLYTKRPSYYWSHVPAETVHDIYFHPVPDYDINLINKKYPMKLVYYVPAWIPFEYETLIKVLPPEQQEVFKRHYLSLESLKDYKKVGMAAYIKKKK